jgi:hypothetical protein
MFTNLHLKMSRFTMCCLRMDHFKFELNLASWTAVASKGIPVLM